MGQAEGRSGAEGDGELPDTAYAILGVLTFGEMSGYDVGKTLASTVAHFFFKPAKSQVYAELRRLVARGYALEREVAQRSRPDKRLYAVTPKGSRALRAWLEGAPVGSDVIRSPLLLRTFFGAKMDRSVLRAQVEDGLRRSRESLAQFQALEREIAGNPELRFPGLVLRRGLAHERASIRWAREVLAELDRWDEEGRRTTGEVQVDRQVKAATIQSRGQGGA